MATNELEMALTEDKQTRAHIRTHTHTHAYVELVLRTCLRRI